MFDRLRAVLQRMSETAEVNALTDHDLDDLGLSRAQLLAFLRMPRDLSERVTAMGEIFGVPKEDLKRDYAQWIDLLTVCGHCTERGLCASVLDKGSAAHASDCGFCGNKGSFAGLAARTSPVAA